MTTEPSTINIMVTDNEVLKSGIEGREVIRGLAKRKAVETKKRVSMIEYRFDEPTKMHHAKVWLKDAAN